MGDVAMTVPVVKALALRYPDLRITVLSRPFAKPFFEGISPNISFMGADVKNEYKHLSGLNELYRRLTAKQFTAVADFHGVLRTEYLRSRFMLDGVKVAHIDKHRKGRKKLCRLKNKEMIRQPSPFQNYADVLAKLGFPVELNAGKYQFSSIKHGAIGIAPTAAFVGKCYPLSKMKEVVRLLLLKHSEAKIYVFGAKQDEIEAITPETFADSGRIINVSSVAKGLGAELELMKGLDVMISMDSANMHFASLVGVPVISIWGQTHPFAGFMGWGQSEENAIQLNESCRPCSIFGNKKCPFGDYHCIASIAPEQIVERI